ncbi:unnamed protein product [Bursaphelenchus xylophilus]|uniref:(pine wood nematode) hypothetical protein n=1 Tax=Bursaphelenchus xylophilus TaxID=6326 RepID=A0A1I7SGE2_BURXY|nr:unnamed protein product [Bursaphelenchus xylophilus]CAG9114050.1 unnamed protein product [Bursaphelenchus xylophilus]
MLFGCAFVLIFTYAIVQIECNITDWSKDFPLPYQFNFTDSRRFEIGCMVVVYVQLQEHAVIGLHDENDNMNVNITVRYWAILLSSRFYDYIGDKVVICEGADYIECTNHNGFSEVIIARVEGGFNVFMNGKRRNVYVYPSKEGTEATFLAVHSEVGNNFEVTGITALLPDLT